MSPFLDNIRSKEFGQKDDLRAVYLYYIIDTVSDHGVEDLTANIV